MDSLCFYLLLIKLCSWPSRKIQNVKTWFFGFYVHVVHVLWQNVWYEHKIKGKLSLCTRWRQMGGHEMSLHSFLTCALEGGEWLVSHPRHFTPGKEPDAHWVGCWAGPRPGLDFLEKQKSLVPARIQNLDLPACSLITKLITWSSLPEFIYI